MTVVPSDDPLGFKVERMLAGEASAKAGRVKPLEVVLDELRRRFASEGER